MSCTAPASLLPGSRTRRKSLPHRLPRRRHPRGALLRLRPVREHASLPAGVQAGAPASRHPAAPVRRQRRQLPLAAPRAGVRQAGRRAHPRPAYQPQGKGKQERWFRTVRAQLLASLSAADTDSLDALNRRLWAWVEGEYHHNPHRGLEGQTPLDRWADERRAGPRLPGPGLDLDALFLFETKRRVQRDRTVSLNGTLFEVDAALVGQTVTLRYDPSAPACRGIEVWHEGTLRRTRHDRWMPTPTASCAATAPPRASKPTPRRRPRARRGLPCAICAAASPRTGPTIRSAADVPHPLRPDPLPLRARAAAR